MEPISIQADYIVVSPTCILHPGRLVVGQGRVLEVTSQLQAEVDVELRATRTEQAFNAPGCPPMPAEHDGPLVLLPGLINCHTHLEFSGLERPFAPGDSFPEWIRSVLAWRGDQQGGLAPEQLLDQRRQAIAAGLRECWCSGSCLVADIVTPPWDPEWFQSVPTAPRFDWGDGEVARKLSCHFAHVSYPRLLALPEVLGHQPARFQSMLEWAEKLVQHPASPPRNSSGEETCQTGSMSEDGRLEIPLQGIGLSPHAPYSLRWDDASREQLTSIVSHVKLAAMHVAESPAEIEWLATGSGPFHQFFDRFQISSCPPRLQLAEAIELLERAEHGLMIHGYYLAPYLMERAARSGRVSLVYCPRTCHHFGHHALDLERLVATGLSIVLGTDSRATNPDLSIWSEMREVRCLHPRVDAAEIFAMATTQAARALGCDQQLGSLEPGKLAFVNVVPLSNAVAPETLLEALLTAGREVTYQPPIPLLQFLQRRECRSERC